MKVLRIILLLSGITGVVWFSIPYFTRRILNIGNTTGIGIGFLLILYGLFMPQVHFLFRCLWTSASGKPFVVGRIICIAMAAVCIGIMITAMVVSLLMIRACYNVPTTKETDDAVLIVLGCRVYGENPSLMLTERLDAAYEYLIEHEEAVCILSGGKGDDEAISEAECMYRYLTARGISQSRLYKEDRSTSTRENLLYSKEIMDANNLGTSLTVVTNEFHEYRASAIAAKLGIHVYALSARTAWWLFPTFTVREMYGILYEFVF